MTIYQRKLWSSQSEYFKLQYLSVHREKNCTYSYEEEEKALVPTAFFHLANRRPIIASPLPFWVFFFNHSLYTNFMGTRKQFCFHVALMPSRFSVKTKIFIYIFKWLFSIKNFIPLCLENQYGIGLYIISSKQMGIINK